MNKKLLNSLQEPLTLTNLMQIKLYSMNLQKRIKDISKSMKGFYDITNVAYKGAIHNPYKDIERSLVKTSELCIYLNNTLSEIWLLETQIQVGTRKNFMYSESVLHNAGSYYFNTHEDIIKVLTKFHEDMNLLKIANTNKHDYLGMQLGITEEIVKDDFLYKRVNNKYYIVHVQDVNDMNSIYYEVSSENWRVWSSKNRLKYDESGFEHVFMKLFPEEEV